MNYDTCPTLSLKPSPDGWRLTACLKMRDKPGELGEVASFMGVNQANIEHFYYNRSENPHLVRIEVRCATAGDAGRLADELARQERLALELPEPEQDEGAAITDLGGVLCIKVNLKDEPGTLGGLANIFRDNSANVIHMTYDSDKTPGLAEITMATNSPDQVSTLLADLNKHAYHYLVEWTGSENSPIDAIVGLSAIEQFLFKLKRILPSDRLDRLKTLIESSDEMSKALLDFRQKAGKDEESMAASEVFTNILHLAATSIGKTGEHFSMRLTGPMRLTGQVALYVLACPTGANGYLLQTTDEDVLIDSGYGLYYDDVKQWLLSHGFDPARIKRAYITHPDADHAGLAAPLQADYGTQVFMHPDCRHVFEHCNRAFGTDTRLQELNVSFTRLITRFTELCGPAEISVFSKREGDPEELGGFAVMGSFEIGDVHFLVLESLGGHVAGQVIFYAPEKGLLFCGDYLIDVPSLSERDKQTMSIPKFLMTSTNSDSRVFAQEMDMLRALMQEADQRLKLTGGQAYVFPGHGNPYAVDEAGW